MVIGVMVKFAEWTRKYPILYVAAFGAVYFTWFTLLEKYAKPVVWIHSKIDDLIPFSRWAIIPYCAWFAFIGLNTLFFMFRSIDDFQNVTRYMFTGMITALIIYTIIPNGLNLRPHELTGDDFLTWVILKLYGTDTPTNVCPSLHVYNSIAMTVCILKSKAFKHPRFIKAGSMLLCIAIILSTMFLKQHSIIDVVWAVVMAAVYYPLSSHSVFKSVREAEKNRLAAGNNGN